MLLQYQNIKNALHVLCQQACHDILGTAGT
jgi:hypothetical protein